MFYNIKLLINGFLYIGKLILCIFVLLKLIVRLG